MFQAPEIQNPRIRPSLGKQRGLALDLAPKQGQRQGRALDWVVKLDWKSSAAVD